MQLKPHSFVENKNEVVETTAKRTNISLNVCVYVAKEFFVLILQKKCEIKIQA